MKPSKQGMMSENIFFTEESEYFSSDFFHMQYFNDNLGSTFSPHINSISNEKGKKRKYIWDHGEDWHHTFEVDPHGTFSSSTGSAFNQEG
ncbi:hypothetical protein PGT21_004146 [Puccinia graminis f. sp. tritici]|uniref:Uncharacterized protein n=1 Tax=Puccinia graminis f. sp. tritici TaxID=56615 RepID=A0A5B0QA28_PUCGR|nr:hypothetical protein PGT21_004146 [Puccinia graminis f. sp. tritici]